MRKLLWSMVVAWGIAIVLGWQWMLSLQAEAGTQEEAPITWPHESRLNRAPDCYTLVMFLHPHCVCSEASLEELGWILSRTGEQVQATVVFVVPRGAPPGWEVTPLLKLAEGIPRVKIVVDHEAKEARLFGAITSGHIVMYDSTYRLVFQGGITAGRGHRGDNPARRELLEQIRQRRTAQPVYPVYGCPLYHQADTRSVFKEES